MLMCTRCFDVAFRLLSTIGVVKSTIGASCTNCVEVALRRLGTIAVVKPTICASARDVLGCVVAALFCSC